MKIVASGWLRYSPSPEVMKPRCACFDWEEDRRSRPKKEGRTAGAARDGFKSDAIQGRQSIHFPTTTMNLSCGLLEHLGSLAPSTDVRMKCAAGSRQVLYM
ncbi:hypothetical protein AbraIFM66951_009676 [Aspergillus brasiliensis]|nr:hypothetical protein AbraIFM66951_009676 [Aspergillus brasiliensis]